VSWRRWLGFVLLTVAGLCVVGLLLIETGIVQRWVRQMVVSQIEQRTGARVELGGFHLHVWQLRTELDDLTLHGLEGLGTAPLFHAAHVNVAIHILSFTGEEIVIDELVFDQPQSIRHMRLQFNESDVARTQEFTVRWSRRPDEPLKEVVRQQWNFSPDGSTAESEDYAIDLKGASVLELTIDPDRGAGEALANLADWRLA